MSGRREAPGRRPVAVIGAPIATSPGAPLSDAALVASLGLRAPGFLFALQGAQGAARVHIWLEVGDALGAIGRWDRARIAWERGLALAEAELQTRTLASSFYWRLGQLCEGLDSLVESAQWYERAADHFRKEGALADEAAARMALARVCFHMSGAGEARQHSRDAVLAAREAGETARPELLGEALELAGEVALDLGHFDEAIATLREAVKQHGHARRAAGVAGHSSDEVRATVALAEAMLDAGQVLAAVTTYESIEGLIEGHDSVETRGRGMGLLAIINLDLGRVAEAAEPLKKAHEWLDAAGAHFRRARLFVAAAQRIERLGGAEDARKYYEMAWTLAKTSGDQLRLAPIGFALARCYTRIGEWVRADDAISKVLPLVQEAADLDGLVRCTELAVRIALKLAQGKLALERLLLLARTRGRLGDRAGEMKGLLVALTAALAVPDMDPASVVAEFMESVRQTGTASFGPAEAMQTAEMLAKGGFAQFAAELATIEAERHVFEGRRSEGARTFAKAALWSVQARDRWSAVELWDRAIALAEEIGLAEVEQWGVERTMAGEG